VTAIFWASLGFFAAAIALGTAFVAARAWRAWRAFVGLAVAAGAGIDLLAAKADRAAARSTAVAGRLRELEAATASLERSRAQARVLLGALGEVRSVARAVAAFAPRG